MVPFNPRAALCTILVVAGFGAAVTTQLPGGLFGLIEMDRDGLLALERGGAARERDQQDIIGAVLAQEARRVERGAVCVDLADEGEALAGERLEIARLQRAMDGAAPEAQAGLRAELERRRNPRREWLSPDPDGRPLGEENARQLRSAETAILGMPPAGRTDVTLDMGSLPESLRSTAPNCPRLTFTGPAMAGEVAFVETHFLSVGGAESLIYAVVRGENGWRIEAIAR